MVMEKYTHTKWPLLAMSFWGGVGKRAEYFLAEKRGDKRLFGGYSLSTTTRSHSRNASDSCHFDREISSDQIISGGIPEWKLQCLFAQFSCCVWSSPQATFALFTRRFCVSDYLLLVLVACLFEHRVSSSERSLLSDTLWILINRYFSQKKIKFHSLHFVFLPKFPLIGSLSHSLRENSLRLFESPALISRWLEWAWERVRNRQSASSHFSLKIKQLSHSPPFLDGWGDVPEKSAANSLTSIHLIRIGEAIRCPCRVFQN